MNRRHTAILVSAFLLLGFSSEAQESRRSWHIYFGEGETSWSPDGSLRAFSDSVPAQAVRRISVNGYASPSGLHPYNILLSERRAKAVTDTVRLLFPGIEIVSSGNGEDWKALTDNLSATTLDFGDIDLVNAIAVSQPVSRRKDRLTALMGGNVYRRLFDELFPRLRRVDIDVVYEKENGITVEKIPSDTLSYHPSVAATDSVPDTGSGRAAVPKTERPSLVETQPPYQKKSFLTLRSNALVPLTNIGIVIPLGKRLSVGADWYSPWFWHDRANSRCFEFQAADIEVRYWLNPRHLPGYTGNTLTGHSLGIGLFGGHFDFERGYRGIQGEAFGGYIDYSYSFYVAGWFRLELSLGLGYARVPWREYEVFVEGGSLIRPRPVEEHYANWFGPVKAGVSAVIPISFKVKAKEGREHE